MQSAQYQAERRIGEFQKKAIDKMHAVYVAKWDQTE